MLWWGPAITVSLRTDAGGAQKKKNKNKLQAGSTSVHAIGGIPAVVTAGDALGAEPGAAVAVSLLPAGNASGFPGLHPPPITCVVLYRWLA